jgi:hypothetical protein
VASDQGSGSECIHNKVELKSGKLFCSKNENKPTDLILLTRNYGGNTISSVAVAFDRLGDTDNAMIYGYPFHSGDYMTALIQKNGVETEVLYSIQKEDSSGALTTFTNLIDFSFTISIAPPIVSGQVFHADIDIFFKTSTEFRVAYVYKDLLIVDYEITSPGVIAKQGEIKTTVLTDSVNDFYCSSKITISNLYGADTLYAMNVYQETDGTDETYYIEGFYKDGVVTESNSLAIGTNVALFRPP